MKKTAGKKKRKSLVGYIYSCEFKDVLCWQDGEWIAINEDLMPFRHKRAESNDNKICGCGKGHTVQKIKVTIEEI